MSEVMEGGPVSNFSKKNNELDMQGVENIVA